MIRRLVACGDPKDGKTVRFIGVSGLLLIMALAVLVPLVVALVDLLKRPSAAWEASGQNQIVWLLVILLITLIGPLLYLFIARPELNRVGRLATGGTV